MKNLIPVTLFILISVYLFGGCKRKITQDLRVAVNTEILQSPIMMRIVNSNASGLPIPDVVNVTISGKDAAAVVTSEGSTDFKARRGFLSLAIQPDRIATAQNPLYFTIHAVMAGFLPITRDIVVTDNKPLKLTIAAVDILNPGNGIANLSNSNTISNGTATSSYQLVTPLRAGITETATLTIAPGTQFLDSKGQLISASSVKTDFTFFSTSAKENLTAFPGGLSTQHITDKNNQPIEGGVQFVTAGLVAVSMNAAGVGVKSFSQPIQAEVQLNPDQDNFVTGQPIQAGDSIPVWSMDETTGEWKYESKASVQSVGGKLTAVFNVTHLSCWNLDWGWGCFGGYNSSPNPLNVVIKTNVVGGNYEIVLETANGNYLGALHCTEIFDKFVALFARTPLIPNAKIVIYDNLKGRLKVSETPLFQPSSKGTIEVTVTGTSTQNVDVVTNVQLYCENTNVNLYAGTWFYLGKESDPSWWQYLFVSTNGASRIQLELNSTYYVYTWFDGSWFSAPITIKKNDFDFSDGSGLSGSCHYDANSNTIYINGKLTVSC